MKKLSKTAACVEPTDMSTRLVVTMSVEYIDEQ